MSEENIDSLIKNPERRNCEPIRYIVSELGFTRNPERRNCEMCEVYRIRIKTKAESRKKELRVYSQHTYWLRGCY